MRALWVRRRAWYPFFVGETADVFEEPAAGAESEVVGVDGHDAESHVGLSGMVETGAHETPGAGVDPDDAAAGARRRIDLVEDLRDLGRPLKGLAQASKAVPRVDGGVDEFGHFRPVLGLHFPEMHRVAPILDPPFVVLSSCGPVVTTGNGIMDQFQYIVFIRKYLYIKYRDCT